MEPRFTLKPNLIGALASHYCKWLWRFLVASAIIYAVLYALMRSGYILLPWWAPLVLVLLSVFLAFIHVKHRIIVLHRTKYQFYDTRVIEEFNLIVKKRHSVPYSQIQRITHKQSLWQRVLDVADLHLETSTELSDKLILKAIKHPDEVEHKISELMQK